MLNGMTCCNLTSHLKPFFHCESNDTFLFQGSARELVNNFSAIGGGGEFRLERILATAVL